MPKSILIVEDDNDIREPMRELLEDEGYLVICVSTGQEALVRLRSGPAPDLILCDLMMPQMTGSQFIQELKSTDEKLFHRTIILSAAAHAEEIAADLGVGYLRKPIDIDVLLATVGRY
jgi:CheY-like chemotaxis protein